jgi:hypothetical protein
MKRLLTLLGQADADHRVVFAAFADGLMRTLRTRAGRTR